MIDLQTESLPRINVKAGATRPTWVVTVKFDDDTALDITGATFAGKLRRLEGATAASAAGSYAITTAATGIFTYSPVVADVAEAGTWLWQTTITISSETYIRDVLVVIGESL